MLLGCDSLEKLKSAHVAVFGLGGVGSWCAEALARSGVGRMTVIDSDEYSLSNINRQAGALNSTIGKNKAEVMAIRLRDINPNIKVTPLVKLYNAETSDSFFEEKYDFVADCIDLVSCKINLIETCLTRQIPIISALGTGNKKDARMLEISDISKTSGDSLARVIRKELRARGINHLPVVFSKELPMESNQFETPPPGRRSIPGSLVWVPASAGFLITQYIVQELIK